MKGRILMIETTAFIIVTLVTTAIGYGAFALMRIVDRLYYEHEEKCQVETQN